MPGPIRLVTMSRGAEYEIDLSCFPVPEPQFAYVDDTRQGVRPLRGLAIEGRLSIPDQEEYMWLPEGDRDCVLLKARRELRDGDTVSLLSLGFGEFCLEIYHVRPDGTFERLIAEDFCFK